MARQFYALSKLYHPDRNPNDSEASNRFIKISEAYTILGSTEKRQRYDRDFQRKSREQSSPVQQSSYSDSGPLGSRPASGLSRRRSHFQGPPPSFYRNGGWGSQRPKRQSQAGTTGPAPADVNSKGWKDSSEPYGGWGNDVPHFDKEKHYRRQEQQEQWRQRRGQDSFIGPGTNGSLLINFLWVSGVISAACLIPAILEKRKQGSNGTNDL